MIFTYIESFYLRLIVIAPTTDNKIYQSIMSGRDCRKRQTAKITAPMRNMKRIRLSAQRKLWNLRENIGNSHTNRYENSRTATKIHQGEIVAIKD